MIFLWTGGLGSRASGTGRQHRSRDRYLKLEIQALQVHYSRYNTENVSNNIKIISREKDAICCNVSDMLCYVGHVAKGC